MSKNILMVYPEEYASFPINEKPDITNNHFGIQQPWSKGMILHHIIKLGEILRISTTS